MSVIPVALLQATINEQVNSIKEQLEGKVEPTLSKGEAMDKLGAISTFVLTLYDKIEDPNLKDEVWSLKANADDLYQEIMDELMGF